MPNTDCIETEEQERDNAKTDANQPLILSFPYHSPENKLISLQKTKPQNASEETH